MKRKSAEISSIFLHESSSVPGGIRLRQADKIVYGSGGVIHRYIEDQLLAELRGAVAQ